MLNDPTMLTVIALGGIVLALLLALLYIMSMAINTLDDDSKNDPF